MTATNGMMSTMSTTTPPPGWYADPAQPHLQRWWNGATWVDWWQPVPTPPTLWQQVWFVAETLAKIWFLGLLFAFFALAVWIIA